MLVRCRHADAKWCELDKLMMLILGLQGLGLIELLASSLKGCTAPSLVVPALHCFAFISVVYDYMFC